MMDIQHPCGFSLQVDKVADRASYMDVCASLRKQQDEEVALSQQLQVCTWNG
jgi:hypothetical protein